MYSLFVRRRRGGDWNENAPARPKSTFSSPFEDAFEDAAASTPEFKEEKEDAKKKTKKKRKRAVFLKAVKEGKD